jgi:hypothetical protein
MGSAAMILADGTGARIGGYFYTREHMNLSQLSSGEHVR